MKADERSYEEAIPGCFVKPEFVKRETQHERDKDTKAFRGSTPRGACQP